MHMCSNETIMIMNLVEKENHFHHRINNGVVVVVVGLDVLLPLKLKPQDLRSCSKLFSHSKGIPLLKAILQVSKI